MDSDHSKRPGDIYLLCAAGTVQHALGHGVRQLRGSCTGVAVMSTMLGDLRVHCLLGVIQLDAHPRYYLSG